MGVNLVMDAKERRALGKRIRLAREKARLDRPSFARALAVHPGSVARWETGGAVPTPYYLERISEVTGAPEGWIRTGEGSADGTAEEETPEQAVAQTEVEFEVERALGIVRLVDGKEDFTPEQRRGLKRDILNTYIDAFQEDGFDTRELYIMLGKVDRGEL